MITEACMTFRNHMDEAGIKYRVLDDKATTVSFNCSNISSITVIVVFDDDGESAAFRADSIANFRDNLFSKGLIVCNELNNHYRWVKFYLDEDQDVTAEADAVLNGENAGLVATEIVQRMVGIVDEAYPKLMLARFN